MSRPAEKTRRIAFFGGSFDPPHRGHLAVARAARAALALDTVLFAPVGAQPLKPRGSTAGFQDRLAMTRLAIAGEPGFEISLADAPDADVEAGAAPPAKPNYTIDTLLALRAGMPAADTLFCLMGADSFRALRRWHRGAEIPFVAPLIVASRPGEDLDNLARILPDGLTVSVPHAPAGSTAVEMRRLTLQNAAGASAPLYLLPGVQEDVSASQIRRVAASARGKFVDEDGLLAPAVAAYIATHGLYRESQPPRA